MVEVCRDAPYDGSCSYPAVDYVVKRFWKKHRAEFKFEIVMPAIKSRVVWGTIKNIPVEALVPPCNSRKTKVDFLRSYEADPKKAMIRRKKSPFFLRKKKKSDAFFAEKIVHTLGFRQFCPHFVGRWHVKRFLVGFLVLLVCHFAPRFQAGSLDYTRCSFTQFILQSQSGWKVAQDALSQLDETVT